MDSRYGNLATSAITEEHYLPETQDSGCLRRIDQDQVLVRNVACRFKLGLGLGCNGRQLPENRSLQKYPADSQGAIRVGRPSWTGTRSKPINFKKSPLDCQGSTIKAGKFLLLILLWHHGQIFGDVALRCSKLPRDEINLFFSGSGKSTPNPTSLICCCETLKLQVFSKPSDLLLVCKKDFWYYCQLDCQESQDAILLSACTSFDVTNGLAESNLGINSELGWHRRGVRKLFR
ncbi:hypothetical protein OG21DRAFT_1523502 [Imleria badia]|nr:hypothetical protein OG21DRAFT_1523502 [Imleria badia]